MCVDDEASGRAACHDSVVRAALLYAYARCLSTQSISACGQHKRQPNNTSTEEAYMYPAGSNVVHVTAGEIRRIEEVKKESDGTVGGYVLASPDGHFIGRTFVLPEELEKIWLEKGDEVRDLRTGEAAKVFLVKPSQGTSPVVLVTSATGPVGRRAHEVIKKQYLREDAEGR
jgi:hypothetical protein